MDDLRKLVEDAGNPVNMRRVSCGLWREFHDGCNGCPGEIGCSKYAALVSAKHLTNIPVVHAHAVAVVLAAATVDELTTIAQALGGSHAQLSLTDQLLGRLSNKRPPSTS